MLIGVKRSLFLIIARQFRSNNKHTMKLIIFTFHNLMQSFLPVIARVKIDSSNVTLILRNTALCIQNASMPRRLKTTRATCSIPPSLFMSAIIRKIGVMSNLLSKGVDHSDVVNCNIYCLINGISLVYVSCPSF